MVAQSCGEVNRMLNQRPAERLPFTDAVQGGLPRGHQGPEQHGRRFRRRKFRRNVSSILVENGLEKSGKHHGF